MPNPFTTDFLLSLDVTIGFKSDTFVVQETQGLIHVPMYRKGNIATNSTVGCILHTGTADYSDFVISPHVQLVTFPINSTQASQCLYVHVYMYLFMYVCMYLSIYLCIYVCMNVHVYVCMYVCNYVCNYVCTYVCTYVYVCMYVCTYVCM